MQFFLQFYLFGGYLVRIFVSLYLEAQNNQNYSEITKYKPLIISVF